VALFLVVLHLFAAGLVAGEGAVWQTPANTSNEPTGVPFISIHLLSGYGQVPSLPQETCPQQ